MTRLPLESWDVSGVEGPEFELNAICAAPSCMELPEPGAHHIWRRSFLGGPFSWVAVNDMAVGNLVRLCTIHHKQLTENAAWLDLEDDGFHWVGLFNPSRVLAWQPPVRSLVEADVTDLAAVAPASTSDGHVHVPEGICPSCKRPLPQPKIETEREEKVPRRTWSITVPKGERENGAEVLDELLEASRDEMAKLGLPYGEADTVRYHVLATTLALFVQHAGQLMSDG